MKSLKKSITVNYIYSLLYQALLLVLPLITAPYISRVLGPGPIGQYSFTQSIVNYIQILTILGTGIYGQKMIAYKQHDKREQTILFWEIIYIRSILLLGSILVYTLIIVYYRKYFLLFLIQYISIFSVVLDISWLFQGNENFKDTALRSMVVKITSVILIFLCVKSPSDLPIYIFVCCITMFLGNMSLWFYLPSYLCKISIKCLNIKRHMYSIITMFIPQIAASVYTVLDKIMIGMITGSETENGYYEQSQKIVKMLLVLTSAFIAVITPKTASAYASGNLEQVKKYLSSSIEFVFFLGTPITFGVILIAENFSSWFFGPGYEKTGILIAIFAPLVLIIGISSAIGQQYLLSTNKQNYVTVTVILGTICNISLNLLLLKKYGAIGAAVASVLSEAIVSISQIICTRNFLNFFPIIIKSKNYIISSVIMFIITYAVKGYFPPGIIETVLTVTIGVIIYSICLIFFKDQHFMLLIKKIL